MYNVFHAVIALIVLLIKTQNMWIVSISLRLVKDTENLIKPVVYLPVQQWNLDYYTIMDKTLDEWIRHSLSNHITVIIVRLVVNIYDRLFNIADTMP